MSNSKHLQFGKIAESAACEYLAGLGCRILRRNLRQKFGEIDIVARRPDGVLCFVEVKALSRKGDFKPEDHFTPSKLRKLKRICEFVANKFQYAVTEKGWQIDLLALTKNENSFEIKTYENIA